MRALVVGEVALASVLLVSAGLMVDNLQRLLNANLGLRAESLYAIALPLPPRYDTAERRVQLVRQLHEAAGAIPGVERAGLTSWNPLDRGSFGASIETEDQPLAPGQSGLIINHRLITPEWMTTAGVHAAAGAPLHRRRRRRRARRWRSSAAASPTACGPARTAVGKRLRQARPENPWITVVGVAGDVRDSGTWAETWYLPYEQHAGTLSGATVHLMVRSAVDAGAVIARAAAAPRRRSIRCCRCPSRR